MGKMKEKFLDERQRAEDEMQNQYLDDDYCCGQACGCHEQRMEEIEQNTAEYDDWWDHLSTKEKNKIYDEQKEYKTWSEQLASLPAYINHWLKK
jgi:hypothetical protein